MMLILVPVYAQRMHHQPSALIIVSTKHLTFESLNSNDILSLVLHDVPLVDNAKLS